MWLLLLFLSLALGCRPGMIANVGSPPPAAQGSTVGVVSLIGPEFRLTHVGLTVFENSEAWCPAAPFDPDEYARQVVKKNVERMGFQYVELKRTSSDFMNAYGDPHGWAGAGHGSIKHLTGELRGVLAKTPAARVLLLRRWKGGQGPDTTIGLGVFHRSLMGIAPRGYVHATLMLQPIDGTSLEVLGSYTDRWFAPLDDLWPGDADCSKITAEQREKLTAKFRDTLDGDIALLLSRVGMALPPATK